MSTLQQTEGGKFKVGSTTYNLVEIKYGGTGAVIWPLNYTYVFSEVRVEYSSGQYILANASNYAKLTAYVVTKRGDTIIDQGRKDLTVTAISDTTHFEIRDGKVYGKNLDDSNKGMGYQSFPNGLTFNITAASYGTGQWTGTASVSQAANTSTQTGTTKTYTGYSIALSTNSFNSSGGTMNVTGTATYTSTPVLTWTSGATSNGTPTTGLTETQAPTTLTVNPSTGVVINDAKTQITLPGNTGSSSVGYTISATFNGLSAPQQSAQVNAPVYSYSDMSITSYTYQDVPASGGTVKPTITFEVKYYLDGTFKGTITGTFTNGATSTTGTCSSTGYSTTVFCAYKYKSGYSYYTDSNNGTVTANTLGTTLTTSKTPLGTRRVVVSIDNDVFDTSADKVVYQAINSRTTTYTQVYTSFDFHINQSSLGSTDTSFTVGGTIYYTETPHYTYASGSTADGTAYNTSSSVTPTITSVTPNTGVSWTGTTVTIPANTGSTQIEYTAAGKYVDPAGRTWTDSDSVVQTAIAYTYGTPTVSLSYEEIADGYHIAAAGNTGNPIYPAISFSQLRTPTSGTADYVTGSVSGGATSGTASDGSAFTVQYFGTAGTGSVSGGGVTAASKGTTVSGITNVATGLYAKITIHSKTGQSSSVIVKQQANAVTSTEETSVTYGISGMAITWAAGGASAKSAGENGTMSYTSCKKYYYLKSYYTSGSSSTASTQSSTDITPTYSADSTKTWVPTVSGSTVTAAKRGKNDTSSRSGAIKAYYSGNLLGTLNISQAGTVQSFSLSSNYASGISFTAAGGEVTPSFSGTVSYDNGDSPDTTSNVAVTFSSGSDVSGRITRSGTKITGTYLGTTPYGATSTSYTWYWNAHSGATHTIAVSQGKNEASYGTITLSASESSVPASGTSSAITFTASCPVTWTSGATSSLGTNDFSFAISSYGNQNKRTYSLSGNALTMGSLGTNLVSSDKTTTVTASKTGVGSKSVNITEAKNVVTGNSLVVQWEISGSPISGSGGTARVGVDSASYVSTYSSGQQSSSSVSSETILDSITASGTGFSYNHASGAEYGQVTATQNPSTTNSRSCTLTASYAGSSATTTVSQYAYVVVIVTQAYSLQGWVGEPTFGINPYTLDRYLLECGGSILKINYSSITSGAAGKTFKVRIDILGEGHDPIGSGTYYCTDTFAVPSSAGTQYESLNGSFSLDSSEVENYSYIRCRFSLEGASGQNLTMSGNYLDLDFYV